MPDIDCTIEPTLAGYIDQKRLEKLLERTFRQKIVVYVGGTEPIPSLIVAYAPCLRQEMVCSASRRRERSPR